MTRLPSLSSRRVIQALRALGFVEAPDRGKGSHRAFYKTDSEGRVRLVVVPQAKDIPRGTLLAIIEQSRATRDEFLRAA